MRRFIAVTCFVAAIAPATGGDARHPAAPARQGAAIGSFGFDETGMDRRVAPGDDFYNYANGAWARRTPIPADKASYGTGEALQDLSDRRTRGLLESAARQPASNIGRAYTAYLDTATIERKGLAPIRPWLGRIAALADKAGYAPLLADAARAGIAGPIAAAVGQDAKHPENYIVSLRQAGLGLPDRDYYLSADATLADAKAAYRAHVATLLTLAGERDADKRADALLAFETEIAKVSWTRIDSRDADKTYNPVPLAQLAHDAPGFDLAAYLKAAGLASDPVIVAQPSAVADIGKLIGDAPLQVLKDQLIVRSFDAYGDVLPRAIDAERFHFAGTILSGTPQQLPRWKRAVQWTGEALTDDVARIYVARYFPPATKAAADIMVANIIAAMHERIDRLAWMAPDTKIRAHAKLDAFTPRIGYPSQWRDYAGLSIVRGDAFGNKWRAQAWLYDFNRAKLGQPIYRWEWGLTPMTVNAQANFGLVAITFPAAILQPPYFDPRADPAINYGGIGAVIGHEMSHHFDDQGSKFDLHGKLTQWWTDEDVARFNALSGRLVAQYDAYVPLPGFPVKGALTLGENSADLAGLAAAYDAWRATLGGKPAPVIDGLTGDQRFYLGWAQAWRRSFREADLRKRLLTDPHAPSEQRTDIVRNMDAWVTAFAARPGQKLYLKPEDRVRIW